MDLAPVELKQSKSLVSFKLKIKSSIPFQCSCKFGKTYIQQDGFLDIYDVVYGWLELAPRTS